MPKTFKMSHKVEFCETDMAGIVHFSNFFRFMEMCETELFRSLNISLYKKSGNCCIGFPRVHADCDYLTPLKFEESVEIRLKVERMGEKSISYIHEFYKKSKGKWIKVAQGKVVTVCVKDHLNGKISSMTIPRDIRGKIEKRMGVKSQKG